MNINSTEDERYEELKDRTLTIVPWDETKPFTITDPSKSLNRCIVDFVKSLGLLNKRVLIPNINYPVKFNKNSLNESIASMCRHQANLLDLAKLFTVFDSIIANSIEIQDEEYRHVDRNKAKDINCMRQYLSGFCDKDKVYPVKITVEERQIKENTFIYVVVTVGVLDRNKMKEALSNVRAHSSG